MLMLMLMVNVFNVINLKPKHDLDFSHNYFKNDKSQRDEK